MELQSSAERELILLASLAQDDLQGGDYQHIPALLKEWGQRRADIVQLKLEAQNGFSLGKYVRPTPAVANVALQTRIDYSYDRSATLSYARDLSAAYARRREMIIQVASIYALVAGLLAALTHFLLLHRREAATLRERSSELKAANAQLEREIDERKIAQAELQRYRDQLEQMVEARTAELKLSNHELEAFSYSVSHDLRGPLRGIDGFSQALREDYGTVLDKTAHDYLQRIRKAAQRMGQIIDDLLKLARVTRSNIEPAEIDLQAEAQTIVADLRALDPQRDVKVSIAPALTVWGDRALIRIALENLLNNAWKFTSQCSPGEISVGKTSAENGQDIFFVKDNGAGFDMQHASHLFEPFQRAHGNAEFEGTGIGLATVKRIVQRHGGRIWAHAEPNAGATFYFTLPGRETALPNAQTQHG